jgi:hypothetical protein
MSETANLDTPAERDEGTRYPAWIKAFAFQLWAFRCSGDAAKVSAMLAAHDPPAEVDPHRIRDWARRYEWAIRRHEDWRTIAPDLVQTGVIDVQLGFVESAAVMRALVNDPTAAARDRIAAAGWLKGPQETIATLEAAHAQREPLPELAPVTTTEEALERINLLR